MPIDPVILERLRRNDASLKSLGLSSTILGEKLNDTDIFNLVNAMHNNTVVTYINLATNDITDIGSAHLAHIPATVQTLDLGCNYNITAAGAITIISNTKLQTLGLHYTGIKNPPNLRSNLIAAFESNRTLTQVNISGNHFTVEEEVAIHRFMHRNLAERPIVLPPVLPTANIPTNIPITPPVVSSGMSMEKRVATAAGFMTAGTYGLALSIALLPVDKDTALKLAFFSIVLAVAGSAVAGHEIGKVVKSTGHRFSFFLGSIAADANRVSETIVSMSNAIQLTSGEARQAIVKLRQTVDESIVILRDETSNTLVELRGRGGDIAAAIERGIQEGRFRPEAHVNANVFAGIPIPTCNIL